MQTLPAITGLYISGSGVTRYSRILGALGIPITQASISAIAYSVTNLSTGLSLASMVALTVANVVFNSLVQNDILWTQDSQYAPGQDGQWGYNFLATIPATAMPGVWLTPIQTDSLVPPDTPSWGTPAPRRQSVQIDFFFTPVVGQPFRLSPTIVECVPVYG